MPAHLHVCFGVGGSLNPKSQTEKQILGLGLARSVGGVSQTLKPHHYLVVSLNYCSQNGGNLYRAPYYNGNPNIGPHIMGNLWFGVWKPQAVWGLGLPRRGKSLGLRLWSGALGLPNDFSHAWRNHAASIGDLGPQAP